MLRLATIDLSQPAAEALVSAYATEADRQAAERHGRPRRRRQFLAARALLRNLAGQIADVPSAAWDIRPNRQMQPELVAPDRAKTLPAAIAHSHDRVAVALSTRGPLGIDLEHARPDRRFRELAQRAFGPREQRRCVTNDGAAFYRIWTLREALAKACGGGFAMVVDGQDYFADAPAAPLWPQTIDGRNWLFAVRQLDKDYVFAIAAPRSSHTDAELNVALAALARSAMAERQPG